MRLDDTQGGEASMVIRFHGVRGSYPVPGQRWVHFGGNTSCVEVEAGPFRVVLDCGTGAIPLGNRMAANVATEGPARVMFLVSHVHHDHTMGWPFFKPVYDATSKLFVYGPRQSGREFKDLFEGAFSDPFFPVPADAMGSERVFGSLAHGDVLSWSTPSQAPTPGEPKKAAKGSLVVRAFRNRNHPNGGVLNYRLERGGRSVVMATDVEGSEGEDGDLADFARGTDVLIHDAQYTDDEYERYTQGWGHSTWRMAADVAFRAQARRLVLYHHDPSHDDLEVEAIERLARESFPRAIAACEGLEIRI